MATCTEPFYLIFASVNIHLTSVTALLVKYILTQDHLLRFILVALINPLAFNFTKLSFLMVWIFFADQAGLDC